MPRFQPEEIFRVLADHRVVYVLVGGVAATLYGSTLRTGDVDICPAREPENLERLAAALRELDARVRAPGAPDGLPFHADGASLARVEILNLVTRHGDFDLTFVPSGTEGYASLAARSVDFEVAGTRVPVAALADVIRSKEAAGRPKDHAQLPTLRLLLEEVERSRRSSKARE